MPLWLVLGGNASGKSEFGESLVGTFPDCETVHYIATLNPDHAEATGTVTAMKISRHRRRRPLSWNVCVEPVHAAERILSLPATDCVLWDGVGPVISMQDLEDSLWVPAWLNEIRQVIQRPGPTVVVSEEVGQGLIPASGLSQRFVEILGQVNRELAREAVGVVMVIAGIPLWIKGAPQ